MKTKFSYFFPYPHAPGSFVPEHRHSCCELVYFVEGTGRSRAADTVYSYRSGELIVYRAGEPHDESHASYTEVYCIGFHINPESGFPFGKFQDPGGYILKKIENIALEFRSKQADFRLMLECLISEILVTLKRTRRNSDSTFDKFLFIKQFINENLNFDINIRTLADISGYSYDHFRHLFKENTGLSPKDYIAEKRVEKAKILLDSTDTYVSDVAAACGYSELSNFSLFFKKRTGESPNTYRQKHRVQKGVPFQNIQKTRNTQKKTPILGVLRVGKMGQKGTLFRITPFCAA